MAATLPNISPDGLETKEIAAIQAILTADLSAAITAASGTPPSSGANITALISALVLNITTALGTARNQTAKASRGFNANIDPNLIPTSN